MRTKVVELNGCNYQLRKLRPDVGSYIYYRMMAVLLELRSSGEAESNYDATTQPVISDEEKARMLCGMASMRLSFEDTKFAQKHALLVVSKAVEGVDEETFIPVLREDGRWVDESMKEDIALVQKLSMESLVFSLAGFFS